MTFEYNIHEIIKISSDVDLQMNYFRVKDLASSDLSIRIVSSINLDTKKLTRIGSNYFGIENRGFVYRKIRGFPFRSEIMLKDIFGKTLLMMTKGYYITRLPLDLSPLLTGSSLITKILHVKLLLKGLTFLHSACISFKNRNEGILLAAYPDIGKTTTTLLALKTGLFDYLSDDMVIVDHNGTVWSYPTKISFKSLKFANFGSVKMNIWRRIGFNLVHRVPYPFSVYMPSLDLIDTHEVVPVKDKTIVKYIFVLEYGKDCCEQLTKEQCFRKLWLNNQRQYSYVYDLLNIYAYLNNNFDLGELSTREKNIISNLVDKAECFCIKATNVKHFISILMRVLNKK